MLSGRRRPLGTRSRPNRTFAAARALGHVVLHSRSAAFALFAISAAHWPFHCVVQLQHAVPRLRAGWRPSSLFHPLEFPGDSRSTRACENRASVLRARAWRLDRAARPRTSSKVWGCISSQCPGHRCHGKSHFASWSIPLPVRRGSAPAVRHPVSLSPSAPDLDPRLRGGNGRAGSVRLRPRPAFPTASR